MNLDIGSIKLPITAYVSILHRVSGCVMFFMVGLLLWLLDTSLSSEQEFVYITEILDHTFAQIAIWGSLSVLAYHMVMGTRHLLMDLGYGESLAGGVMSAKISIIMVAFLICMIGWWVFS